MVTPFALGKLFLVERDAPIYPSPQYNAEIRRQKPMIAVLIWALQVIQSFDLLDI
jgi:hypothetical protein